MTAESQREYRRSNREKVNANQRKYQRRWRKDHPQPRSDNHSRLPIPIPQLSEEEMARFWSKVQKTETCWIWIGTRNREGYGNFKIKRKTYLAHRVSLSLAGFDLPLNTKFHPDHTCRNPGCIRPEHLEVVSNRENTLRGIRAQRVERGQ